jgi:hypothetical protein
MAPLIPELAKSSFHFANGYVPSSKKTKSQNDKIKL